MENFKPPSSLIGQQLLAVIQESSPEWLSREKIAERIGRDFLNGYAVSRLDMLVNRGLIKTRKVPQQGKTPYFEYQAVVKD